MQLWIHSRCFWRMVHMGLISPLDPRFRWPVFCSGLGLVALSWLVFLALLWGLGLVSITPAAPTLPTWPCCP